MTKGSIILATGLIALCVGAQGASAKVNNLKLKIRPAYSTAKTVTGTASKKTTVQVTRYKVNYGAAKVRSNGKFTVRLKHKLHAGWSYRVTVIQKGYHFKNTYAIYLKIKSINKPNNQDSAGNLPISSESNNQKDITPDQDPDANLNPPDTDDAPLEVVPNGRKDPDDISPDSESESGYHLVPSTDHYEYYTSDDISQLKAQVYDYQNKMQAMMPQINDTKSHLAALQKNVDLIDQIEQMRKSRTKVPLKYQREISQNDASAIKEDYYSTKDKLAKLMFVYNGYQTEMYIVIHQLENLNDMTFSHPIEHR